MDTQASSSSNLSVAETVSHNLPLQLSIVNAELRVAAYQQMNVVGHDLNFDELLSPLFYNLPNDSFEPSSMGGIKTLRRYLGQNTTW